MEGQYLSWALQQKLVLDCALKLPLRDARTLKAPSVTLHIPMLFLLRHMRDEMHGSPVFVVQLERIEMIKCKQLS